MIWGWVLNAKMEECNNSYLQAQVKLRYSRKLHIHAHSEFQKSMKLQQFIKLLQYYKHQTAKCCTLYFATAGWQNVPVRPPTWSCDGSWRKCDETWQIGDWSQILIWTSPGAPLFYPKPRRNISIAWDYHFKSLCLRYGEKSFSAYVLEVLRIWSRPTNTCLLLYPPCWPKNWAESWRHRATLIPKGGPSWGLVIEEIVWFY